MLRQYCKIVIESYSYHGKIYFFNIELELKFIYGMMFPHTNTFRKVQINIFLKTMPFLGEIEASRLLTEPHSDGRVERKVL